MILEFKGNNFFCKSCQNNHRHRSDHYELLLSNFVSILAPDSLEMSSASASAKKKIDNPECQTLKQCQRVVMGDISAEW